MRRFLLWCAALSLLALVQTASPALAADCPALRISDIAQKFQGREIMSNSAPLEYGVRLTWENPTDSVPIRTHIYRKEFGKPFVKLAQTSNGTQNFYLDKTTSKTVPGYAYALKSEFFCGGTLWSEPIVVLTDRRTMDSTPPLVQFILPQGSTAVGDGEDVFVYVRDLESGVAEKTIQVKRGTTSINAGANLGTPQHALYRLSSLGLQANSNTVTVTVQNGADIKTEKSITLSKGPMGKSLSWSTPAAGVLDQRVPLNLAWTLPNITEPKAANVHISYSTNFGGEWVPLTIGDKATSYTVERPLESFKGLKNAGILWLKLSYTVPGEQYGSSVLPLFVSNTTLRFASGNFIADASGSIGFSDAMKGTKVSFTEATPMVNDKDMTKLTIANEEVTLALKPGFYALEEFMDNFVWDATTPASSTAVMEIGSVTSTIPVYPYALLVSNRKSLSSDGEGIISNLYDPQALWDANTAYETKKNIKPVAPVDLPTTTPATPSLSLKIQNCTEQGSCANQNFTGNTPITLDWDVTKRQFEGGSGTGTSITGSPILARMLTIEVDSGLALHIPSRIMNIIPWSSTDTIQVHKTAVGYRWDLPEKFVKAAQSMTGFIKVSLPLTQDQICTDVLLQRRDASGNIVPLPTLCATDRVIALLLPYEQTELITLNTRGDLTVLQGDAWYVPYMNQFQLWGMLYTQEQVGKPEEDITRGELAYLLHKAFQYPTGAYQAELTYSDLPATHPLAPYMLGMVSANIMSGDATGQTIRPESPVNRAEALKMILTAAHLQAGSLPSYLLTGQAYDYADVPTEAWFAQYISRASQLGIVGGYVDGTKRLFKPQNTVNRAEALKMIFTALEKKTLE